MKTVNISETIEAYDLKVCRSQTTYLVYEGMLVLKVDFMKGPRPFTFEN